VINRKAKKGATVRATKTLREGKYSRKIPGRGDFCIKKEPERFTSSSFLRLIFDFRVS
jgi:hypothetical protein